MSEAALFAGKRGSGKGLASVAMCGRYLKEGKTVATNINLFVEHLVPAYNGTVWYRLPDWPTAEDFKKLPLGNSGLEWRDGEADPVMLPGYKESNNGLLALDEVATFLNSRSWSGNGRQEIINWLVQSRKYGWDLLVVAQHANLIDKAIRESLIEVQGTMRRMDKIQVPILSTVWKYFTGKPLHFPKVHFIALRYGFNPDAPIADRKFFAGTDLYKAYDTLQRISPETGVKELKAMPSAWDIKGSKMAKWDLRRQMAAGGLVFGLLLGFGGGYLAAKLKPSEFVAEVVDPAVRVRGVITDDSGFDLVLLSDGRSARASAVKHDKAGRRYRVGATWYAAQ